MTCHRVVRLHNQFIMLWSLQWWRPLYLFSTSCKCRGSEYPPSPSPNVIINDIIYHLLIPMHIIIATRWNPEYILSYIATENDKGISYSNICNSTAASYTWNVSCIYFNLAIVQLFADIRNSTVFSFPSIIWYYVSRTHDGIIYHNIQLCNP